MVFITPWGLYRYKRNAMGLINAGYEHNRCGDEAIAGIENVKKIVEDILIYDIDLETHLRRVHEVLKRCQKHGITPSRRKSSIAEKAVTWYGYCISEDGYTANLDLVEALRKFPVSQNITDAWSFSGLVQQFEPLSARLTELLKPIRAAQADQSVDFPKGKIHLGRPTAEGIQGHHQGVDKHTNSQAVQAWSEA